ncbi:RHS repeat-associated core domain-containing protein [Streptomyces sp. AcH 505]|uniref:RHS repeat-associated core domain-containing protein n=1 Tax=Streptomyces sp. AcH 505 TaxID=352211 RepID=UPI00325B58FD
MTGMAQAVQSSGQSAVGLPDGPEPVPVKTVPLKPIQTATSRLIARQESVNKTAAKRALRDQTATVTWPAAATTTLATPPTGTAKATAGSLPVSVSAPANKAKEAAPSVKVAVLSRKQTAALGIKGVALTVRTPRGGGTADLAIDYSAFAGAYGGDWAGRLQVLRLPDCALDQPGKASCRNATPLEYTNERVAQRLRTRLDFNTTGGAAAGGQVMVLALAAGEKSGGGDYKATPLAASSTWEAGGSSGTFTWNYPLRTPPAAAGPSPDLAISYDSGSIDGRTANTNNQGSQIGEGFDLTSSYVERKYGPCDDDGQADKFDLCWKYDNASLVLNGKATELVKNDSNGEWRLKNDDASVVTHSTGADNGDDGDSVSGGKGDGKGEYWTVITGGGTKYVFGLNKLDGAGSERTNSVWTVPVFGDDDGEPGYSSGTSLSGRSKTQAWRWNLDYVEDVHGNAMSYWYTAETNNYDTLGDDTTGTRYTRGGYLTKILYGQRAHALFTGTPAASDEVTFAYDERCIRDTGCDSLTESTSPQWPDVPFDAICKDDVKCTGNVGPTFFTRKRLTAITTRAWNAALTPSAGFQPVDSWKLTQKYQDAGETGDSADQSLWLQSIQHTGEHGTPLSMDPVTFTNEFLKNRVDGDSDDILPLAKPRLTGITSETGAKTAVTYADAECVAGETMPRPDQNTRTCYPVRWKPNGGGDAILDWFQKYPVTAVSTSDQTGASGTVTDTYQYSGGGAWHYDDDPMTPEKDRTWSIWRGFAKVTHLTGRANGTRGKNVSIYMRGMNGDRLLKADGKTLDPDARRSAQATGVKAAAITDADQYAGFSRETVTYDGDSEVTGTVNDPWSKRTATQHKSYADTEAYYVRTSATHARTNVTVTSPVDRVRTAVTTYDDYGMPLTVEDKGDDAVTGDETCTRTWYARDASAGLTSLVSRTRVTAKPCATAESALDLPADSATPGDVISDSAVTYDATTAWTADQSPTLGEPRWTGRAAGYDTDGKPSWQKISTTTFDDLGRPRIVKDTNDKQTSNTTYTPVAAGPLTAMAVADAKSYTTNTVIDFASGTATKVTDPNSKITESTYDSLGRVTQTWLPTRPRLLGNVPNYKYAYHLSQDSASWVSTDTIRPTASGYTTGYTIYDSLLRARETQVPSPAGGRIVNLTQYDTRGLVSSTLSDIWDKSAPPSGDDPATVEGSQAPMQVDTTYDGAGRPVTSETKVQGVHRWSTTTTYQGDRVLQTAPTGGQATATLTNALGQTTESREFASDQLTGSYNHTRYTYTPGGQPKTITAHDTSVWSYAHDLFGRQTSTTDPDKGTTNTHYTNLDQVDWTQDAEDRTLFYQYDDLGRKTDLWQDDKTVAANKLAHWDYDQLAKGQQDTATRYVGGTAGQAYVQKVTKFDNLYRAISNQLTLPATDPLVSAGLPQTLTFSSAYNAADQLASITDPAVAGLAAETITSTYDDLSNLKTVRGTEAYLVDAGYSELGDPTTLTLGTDSITPTAKKVSLNYRYENGTRRLNRSFVADTDGNIPQDLTYAQDDAGNITSISDASTLGGTGKTDNQCFSYDGYRRLTEAWTPKTADCSDTGRTTGNLGGAAPYWTSYGYTASGQRSTETQHLTTGDQATTYAYGTATGQPHPLARTTGAKNATYTYDDTGNTISRPGATATAQSLTWNSEDQLSGLTEGTKKTSYLYDAAGNLLIRRATGDGDTVLYLGDMEVRLTVKGTTKSLSGTRYYTAGGQTVAVRTATVGTTGTKLNFLATDPHGTSDVVLAAGTYAATKRYTTPFGAPRGTAPTTWPDDKAFLGKPADTTTGLTHIGAREYDPGIGQFISVDPLLETAKGQTLNGYSYSLNNPTTFTDPTGLGNADCMSGVVSSCTNGVPDSNSIYHPDRENAPCRMNCNTDVGGTATAPTSGSGNSGSASKTGSLPAPIVVPVPEGWKYANQYVAEYTKFIISGSCGPSGEWSKRNCGAAYTNGPDEFDVQRAKFAACINVGGCPESMSAVAGFVGAAAAAGMIVTGEGARGSVRLFKAPQRSQGKNFRERGFKKEDFPGEEGGLPDGQAYFAKNNAAVAEKYAKAYGQGVIEIRIPKAEYERLNKREYLYEGGPDVEVVVPKASVEELNRYEWTWHEF